MSVNMNCFVGESLLNWAEIFCYISTILFTSKDISYKAHFEDPYNILGNGGTVVCSSSEIV